MKSIIAIKKTYKEEYKDSIIIVNKEDNEVIEAIPEEQIRERNLTHEQIKSIWKNKGITIAIYKGDAIIRKEYMLKEKE